MKSTFCNESHILEKHSCNFPFEFASIGPSSQLVPGSSVQRSVGMLHAVCKEKKRADIQAFDIQNLEKKVFWSKTIVSQKDHFPLRSMGIPLSPLAR